MAGEGRARERVLGRGGLETLGRFSTDVYRTPSKCVVTGSSVITSHSWPLEAQHVLLRNILQIHREAEGGQSPPPSRGDGRGSGFLCL